MINETLGDLLRECVFGRGRPDLENRHLDDLGRHSHAVAIPMDQLDGHDNQQRNLKKKQKGKRRHPIGIYRGDLQELELRSLRTVRPNTVKRRVLPLGYFRRSVAKVRVKLVDEGDVGLHF
jgi:hypothetical protein